jgi:hypothetical protein
MALEYNELRTGQINHPDESCLEIDATLLLEIFLLRGDGEKANSSANNFHRFCTITTIPSKAMTKPVKGVRTVQQILGEGCL